MTTIEMKIDPNKGINTYGLFNASFQPPDDAAPDPGVETPKFRPIESIADVESPPPMIVTDVLAPLLIVFDLLTT